MTLDVSGVLMLLVFLGAVMAAIAKKKNREPVVWFLLAFVPALNIVFLIALVVLPSVDPDGP